MLLEELLRPAGLRQVEAARRMNAPLNRLNEIIRGKRGISADTALRLGRLFRMSPEFWTSLQLPVHRGARRRSRSRDERRDLLAVQASELRDLGE